MEFTTNLYKAYKGLVHAKAIELSNQYRVDVDLLSSEGMVLFTRAVSTFDSEKKIAFSTHLYWTLKNLEKFAQKERRALTHYFTGISDNKDCGKDCSSYNNVFPSYNEGFFEQAIATIDFSQEKYDLLHDIAKSLSDDAQVYLLDLFRGVHTQDRNIKGGRPEKFPVEKIATHYNWSFQQAKNVKSEITEWWNDYKIA